MVRKRETTQSVQEREGGGGGEGGGGSGPIGIIDSLRGHVFVISSMYIVEMFHGFLFSFTAVCGLCV